MLALYTDGLIEGRDRNAEEGLGALRQALAQPVGSLQAACGAVIDAMRPGRCDDDIALLPARTRAPPTEQVAAWDVLSEPAAVAQARKNALHQLTWGWRNSRSSPNRWSANWSNANRYGQPAASQLHGDHFTARRTFHVFGPTRPSGVT
jgi:hypothetical protein